MWRPRSFSSGLEQPALFRVHEGPSAEKLENLARVSGRTVARPARRSQAHARALSVVTAAPWKAGRMPKSCQTMLLRSLSQAVYQPENAGHFGLHYEAYAHFTSPIRRYPDLLGAPRDSCGHPRPRKSAPYQRVKGAQRDQARKNLPLRYGRAMVALGEQCSMTERRADDATREVDAWLKCEFLKDRIGEEFAGVIAAVTNFGVFVELNDLYIEGLMHVSALPGDYYHFDQVKQRLIG